MKKIVLGVLLSFFVVGNCYGHSFNGTYTLDGWKKNTIVINGNRFNMEIREDEPDTYGFYIKDGIIKESGNKVNVYDGQNKVFEIKKRGNSIRLIPIGDPENIIKSWDGKKFNKDDWVHPRVIGGYWEMIPEWKWKKVK